MDWLWWWWLDSCDGGWMLVVGIGFFFLALKSGRERVDMVTVAILHINSILDRLTWVIFDKKCVKLYKI